MTERRLLTVRGANLAPTPRLACSFAGVALTPATFIASDVLRCEAPAASAISTTELRIGLDQEHWSALALPFTFYDDSRPPTVTSIDGPSFGGNAFGPNPDAFGPKPNPNPNPNPNPTPTPNPNPDPNPYPNPNPNPYPNPNANPNPHPNPNQATPSGR